MSTPKKALTITLTLLYTLLYTFYCVLEALVVTFVPRQYRKKGIKGTVALVTGGGSGIGQLMCVRLAERGAIVVTWDVNQAGNSETVRKVVSVGGQCRAYTVDLCDRHAIYAAANKVKQEVGKVDILINNAGVVTGKKLLDSPDESILRTFQVNAICHFWTTKAFLGEMMAKNKGHIVTISSMTGKFACNGLIDYSASKHAAVGFDEGLRMELMAEGKTGVKTTVVCPELITTGLFKGFHGLNAFTPEFVATEVIDAMQMNQAILLLPSRNIISLILKSVLPVKAQLQLMEALKVTHSMDHFEGRKKSN